MKRRSGKISTGLISWLVILTISLVFFPHTALAVEYTFTSIDVPGAGGTLAYGINDAGNIVGYHDGVGSFLDVGGNFTPIIYPDAEPIFTFAYGINDAGNIVGFYVIVDATVRSHGFLYAGNNFTSINYPGASSTYAFGINDAGNIVGYYQDPEDHGFLLDVQGNFTCKFSGGHLNP